jgi:ribosomal protein S18 acetylase RimI-like enzyme
MPLFPLSSPDLPAVVELVNSAYRGESSRQGWTNEADYVDGARTTVQSLERDLEAQPGAALLGFRDEPDSELLGCVWLEPAGSSKWYLGLLTVRPNLQDRKLGRTILEAAEQIARDAGAQIIRMTVVSIRDSLIAWYQRRGYQLTGEALPFPYDDNRFGAPRRLDLSFTVLEKRL